MGIDRLFMLGASKVFTRAADRELMKSRQLST